MSSLDMSVPFHNEEVALHLRSERELQTLTLGEDPLSRQDSHVFWAPIDTTVLLFVLGTVFEWFAAL
jgi:hypothetical protein